MVSKMRMFLWGLRRACPPDLVFLSLFSQVLKEASQMNLLARVWWYRPFQYFEKNVQGIVPRSYHWPFPWPVVHLGRQVKYSRLVNDT